MAETKLSDIIGTSLEKIKEFADSETVVGDPISVGETTIIPVSKISMGFASGGIDYNGKNKSQKESSGAKPNASNFGGGGGTGVNITPIAFLVISSSGSVDILPVTQNTSNDSVEKITSLIERSPEILQRIKNVFVKNKSAEGEETKAE